MSQETGILLKMICKLLNIKKDYLESIRPKNFKEIQSLFEDLSGSQITNLHSFDPKNFKTIFQKIKYFSDQIGLVEMIN
jgi:hypothetical protein